MLFRSGENSMYQIPQTLLVVMLVLSLFSCGADTMRQQGSPKVDESRRISPDLNPFLESYFATWSSGDMEGYKSHFHESATVTLVEKGKVLLSMPRDKFVQSQAEMVSPTDKTKVERMTSFTAEEDSNAASVTAKWLLEIRGKKITGVDRFTLIRTSDGGWKIISLLFYSDP
jgi:ketosteroid isomerase-like protein